MNLDPAKNYPDYALFVSDDPGIELALNVDARTKIDRSMHLGIVATTTEAVDESIARLKAAGYPFVLR